MTTPTPTIASGHDGSTPGQAVESLATQHPGLVTLSRAGWVAKGVVYGLVGVLAIPIAFQDGGSSSDSSEASQTGAVARIAESGIGVAVLWAIALGLLLYVAWRVMTILLPTDGGAKAWATRIGYGVSAAVYLTLSWTAISLARAGGGAKSEDSRVESITRSVMENSFGRWAVGIAGLAVAGIGVYFVIRGVRATFRKELEPNGVGPISHEQLVTLGRIGWVGRGLMFALIGWFLLRAAVRFDPEDAAGFDDALRQTTGSAFGSVLVGVIAVALLVYGLFSVVSAPRQRLRGAD